MDNIVVTGIGPVSAIGIGRAAWERGLAQGRSGIGMPSRFSGNHPVAEVQDLRIGEILTSVKSYLDRAGEFVLAAGQLALQDAGLATDSYNRWRAGVIMGSEFGCLGTMQTYTQALQAKGARAANAILFSHMYHNTPASLAAIEFNLGGHHGAFAGAGAGQQALDSTLEAFALRRADVLLVIGVDVVSEPLYRAMIAEGALGDDALGEGACALVLETTEHAASRQANGISLGEVNVDGRHLRPQLGRTFAAESFFALAQQLAGEWGKVTR